MCPPAQLPATTGNHRLIKRAPENGASWLIVAAVVRRLIPFLGEGSQSLLTSAATVQRFIARKFISAKSLPAEREMPAWVFALSAARITSPVLRPSKCAASVSPSPWGEGRDEGGQIKGPAVRGGAGGRDSSGSRRRRWCRQKEIAKSAIRRGRRKMPRWLCLDDAIAVRW